MILLIKFFFIIIYNFIKSIIYIKIYLSIILSFNKNKINNFVNNNKFIINI